jgi:FdrA protein
MTALASSGVLSARVFPRLYRDSVALMALASGLERTEGVEQVGAVMATPANLDILGRSGMCPPDVVAAPDDLLVVVRAVDAHVAEAALRAAEDGLQGSEEQGAQPGGRPAPGTIREALAQSPDATLVAISTPGTYAPIVAEQALRAGRHVFCFSDNVSIDDERRLKGLAVDSGLLLMGPDCGTGMLDSVPLGFANVVRAGPIGIVSASGTGAQEVACLLHHAGTGVSQIVGVGGRDLTSAVGGLMTHHALDVVAADPATDVVVVVSKPPDPEVAEALLAHLARLDKPTVACLLGMDDADAPVRVRGTLEAGARAAAELVGHALAESPIDAAPSLSAEKRLRPGGIVRGLFAGGTLASEAKYVLRSLHVPAAITDLGDDQYTAGRPHPMIDSTLRAHEVAATGEQPDVAVLLLDVVLGHGSNPDPAGPIAEAVRTARDAAARDGFDLPVVASVCGTELDPQGLAGQQRVLLDAGVILKPSAAAAARAAAEFLGTRDGSENS